MRRLRAGSRVRIWHAVGVVILLTLAACGGDDDAAEPATDVPADTDEAQSSAGAADNEDQDGAEDEEPAAVEGGAPNPDDFDFGTGIARVTIGDTTYEFDLTAGFTVCQDIFGGLQVAGNNASGDANIDMWVPPLDWETYTDGRFDPPSIIVEDDTLDTRWIADANRVELIPDWPPESRVDSYTKDGDAATGSATFVDDYAFDGREPVEGTFEVACES